MQISPGGIGAELSFRQFAQFSCATACLNIDPYWEAQIRRATIPGIKPDLIGNVERFDIEFRRVLDQIRDAARLRFIIKLLNKSDHRSWSEYYDGPLAEEIYRTYKVDFDTFRYSRSVC